MNILDDKHVRELNFQKRNIGQNSSSHHQTLQINMILNRNYQHHT